MLLEKVGYMQKKFKIGDIVNVEEGDITGTVVFIDNEGDGWVELLDGDPDECTLGDDLRSRKSSWATVKFKNVINKDKYYTSTQYSTCHILYPIKKTRLALKMIPKKDILKEDEEWLWVKS